MSRIIKTHGLVPYKKDYYKCVDCQEKGPLLYGFQVKLKTNEVRYLCRCRGCGRLVSIDIRCDEEEIV